LKSFDSVTGATNSSNDFKKLAQAALDNAKAGKTEEAVVENK
jgi:major membrane immunogen (membrane-anchored lipoprotein)